MKHTIIYDGNCKFCIRFVKWVYQKNNNLETISVRELHAKSLLRSKGIKFIDLQSIYFITHDKILVRSKAVLEILSLINYPWKILCIFKYLPTSITDWGYKIFAKYRYYF